MAEEPAPTTRTHAPDDTVAGPAFELRHVPAPLDLNVQCPFPGCGTKLTVPLRWSPSPFNQDIAVPSAHTDALLHHFRAEHPATWSDKDTPTVLGPVFHDAHDAHCQWRKTADPHNRWAIGFGRCPVCRPDTQAVAS